MPSLADHIMQGIMPGRPDISVADKMIEFFSRFYMGEGTPEGEVSAFVGSWYSDITNGSMFKKVTGDGTDTGWVEFSDAGDQAADDITFDDSDLTLFVGNNIEEVLTAADDSIPLFVNSLFGYHFLVAGSGIHQAGTWTVAAQASTYYFGTQETSGSPGAQNDALRWNLPMAAGTWKLGVYHRRASDAGIYTPSFDGTEATPVDGYAAVADSRLDVVTGIVIPTSKIVDFRLTMATKNASSTQFTGRFSGAVLTRIGV